MRKTNSFLAFLLITLIGAFLISPLLAQDSATLLKTVNKDLRSAERDMFSGKTEKAIASLENIEKMLTAIRADDPNNPKLKTAENKFNKLVKDLERRTGKSLGGGTLTSQASSSKTQLAEKPVPKDKPAKEAKAADMKTEKSSGASSEKVPFAARQPLNNANNALNSLDGNLQKLADPSYTGNKDQLVGNIEKKLSYAKESLDKAKKLAAEKGVTSHPDFDAVDTKIGEAEKSIASAKSGYEENKAAAAASAKEVDADVADLKAVYDKADQVFSKATGNVLYYNDLKTVEDVIVQIENFEKNDLANVKSKMKAFAAKYGTSKDEIDKKADGMGYAGTYYRASYPYTELAAGIENIAKTRDVMAEDLVRRTTSELDGIGKGAEFNVLERYQKVRDWLKMAIRYQPENAKVKELQNSIDKRIEDGMKEFHAKVDARTWPGHASNAPSNADELAKASLDWFKNSPDWGKRSSKVRHPLAVTVTGPWSVQKKNLLGEPIMYGLPIKLAVKVDEDSELNVVRVYDLTMRTAEARGVKMEPPFDHITVGNSYFIRPEKVK
ncbi:MAG: hypothetical protein P8Y99_17360 [Calditrichaceae bacterium]